jgi:hypothetical protein
MKAKPVSKATSPFRLVVAGEDVTDDPSPSVLAIVSGLTTEALAHETPSATRRHVSRRVAGEIPKAYGTNASGHGHVCTLISRILCNHNATI